MAHLLDAIKTWVENTIPWGGPGYVVIFLLMTVESACIPIPSEITMPFAGLLAFDHHLNIVLAIIAGILGNLAGSLLSYAVGRTGGRVFLERYGKYVLIKPHDIERADVWFARYGTPAVFFSRLLPVLRTFISLPAGVAEVPVRRFTLLTVLGCIPWVTALTVAGYELGNNWQKILKYTHPLTYAVAGILVVLIVIYVIRKVRARSDSPA